MRVSAIIHIHASNLIHNPTLTCGLSTVLALGVWVVFEITTCLGLLKFYSPFFLYPIYPTNSYAMCDFFIAALQAADVGCAYPGQRPGWDRKYHRSLEGCNKKSHIALVVIKLPIDQTVILLTF